LVIGPNPQSPIPNPQSPIPNPQLINLYIKINFNKEKKITIFLHKITINKMASEHLCRFERIESEDETLADEDYKSILSSQKKKVGTSYVGSNYTNLSEGPNINLKYFKKKYDTEEEKHFITKKIRTKKKTELCKNWEIYHDCFYKNECSFAHGLEDLRTDINISGSKNRLCTSFQEKGYCLFGKRCNYRHIIAEKRLFTYESLVGFACKEILSELKKPENKDCSILKIYKRILLNRRIVM